MLTVESVVGRTGVRRFRELPFALHADDPRWAPPLLANEDARLEGDVAAWLARRDGRPVGRVAAHEDGRFGFFDCVDDPAVASALLGAAREWVGGPLRGPAGFGPDEEAGVLVEGFSEPGATGRPWHPPFLSALLEGAGLWALEDRPAWRLPAGGDTPLPQARGVDPPTVAAGYWDPALARTDGEAGVVVAVPDLAPVLRGKGVRSAWALARLARAREWDGAVVVRCDGDPAVLVPGLLAALGHTGYHWVLSPWAPDDRPPTVVHRLYADP